MRARYARAASLRALPRGGAQLMPAALFYISAGKSSSCHMFCLRRVMPPVAVTHARVPRHAFYFRRRDIGVATIGYAEAMPL